MVLEVSVTFYSAPISKNKLGKFQFEGNKNLNLSFSGPVATSFIIQTCCRVHYNYNETVCQGLSFTDKNDTDIEALVQPYASVIITGMNILSVFFPVIISLFLGAWSDKNGRKLLLTIPTIGIYLFNIIVRKNQLIFLYK